MRVFNNSLFTFGSLPNLIMKNDSCKWHKFDEEETPVASVSVDACTNDTPAEE